MAHEVAAQAVADQHRALELELEDDRVEIGDEVRQRIHAGLAAVAVAAQVEQNDPVAVPELLRQGIESRRQVLNAVQQDQGRRFGIAVVVDLQLDAARTGQAETLGR